MFGQQRMIRCKKCKRLFSNYADDCPECHTRTRRGWYGIIIPIVCVILAIAAIALAIHFLNHRPQ